MIFLTIAMFIMQSLSLKIVKADTFFEKLAVNGAFASLGVIVLLLWSIPFPAYRSASTITLAAGAAFGIFFSLTILFYHSAIACGALSYTSFYLSASMLLPSAVGIIFFGEPLRLTLVIAVLCFLTAFYLLSVTGTAAGSEQLQLVTVNKSNKTKWLCFSLLTFLSNGLSGTVQKTHQNLTGGHESAGLMLVGFASAALCYFILLLINKFYKYPVLFLSCLKINRIPILLLAFASLGGNLLLTNLAGKNPSSYLYPVVQGSILLGVTICSVLFFREVLSLRGKLGILAGALGIVMIHL